MNKRTACILGGTGFVGRHLASHLVNKNWQVCIPSRHPERHRDLLVLPTARVVTADIHDPLALKQLFTGCDVVINLIGILNENKKQLFRTAHVELPRKIMDACHKTHVPRLLHMSALNADAGRAPSKYLRTKGEGKNLVHQSPSKELHVTSFCPSVIFGFDDNFFNRFASLLKSTPFVFPLACPDTKFAPVYVDDVARAFAASIDNKTTFNQYYDLCGPHTYTLKQLVEYTAQCLGIRRNVIGLGDMLSRLQASLLELFPGKPFTQDNYQSLQIDSVCEGPFPEVFGITPTAVESVVPLYLADMSQRMRYYEFRQARNGS